MRQSAFIIENKKTDTNTNKKKYSEWLKVQSKFKKLTGKHRDVVQLKGFWRRYKLHAKKKLSLHKSAIQATGGGQQPEPPSQEDLKVINLCATDFIVERNTFDSDGVNENMEKIYDCASDTQKDKHNSTNYDTELNEGEDMDEIETENKNRVHIHKENRAEQNNDSNEKIKTHPPRRRYQKTENSHKGIILSSNLDLKKRRRELMEEEHALKIKYQQQEITHQHQRHKLEIAILLLEKEKKELELKKVKNSLE
ncbi:uncharacterized protein LOC115442760 isoform X1 [Manduca sexta]|uniref:uncharacterized protein LOC115442760 isoform X1 n=1 Tax=Manduca sexta TaxID=7130 RepID=UPI0018904D39|nr:uncharacterized protein LOC115442760 isoform X1 [Manduca sexta]